MQKIEEVLKDLRDGELLKEFQQAIPNAIAAVMEHGRGAKITLTLSIKPKSINQVWIADDLKVTLPEADKESTVLFVADDQTLTRRDPRQPKLPMAVVRSINGGERADSE